MKKILFLFVLIIAGAFSLFAQSGMNNGLSGKGSTDESIDALRSGFTRPGSDYRALPLGFKQKNETMSGYTDRLVDGGWGGANMAYPLRGKSYLLDEEGWRMYGDLLRESEERDLRVWIYDEAGYPSGRAGHLLLAGHPEFEAEGLFYDARDIQVRSSRSPGDPYEVEWCIPEGDPYYVALYALNRHGHIEGMVQELTGSVMNGTVKIALQPGSWRLMAFVKNRLYEGRHAEVTGGPYINILNPKAVGRFLDLTHEAFYSRFGNDFGKIIKAVFNDEVSLMSGLHTDDSQPYPAIAWYHGYPELFRGQTGYDIRECLPALFDDIGPATIRKRCDFYSMQGEQIAKAFFGQVRDWCKAHGVASTGHLMWEESLIYHAHEYGTVFPSYRELDWPGIDVLFSEYGHTSGAHTEGGPVTPKLASSAAHIWERERTMSESFWSVTHETPIEEVIAHYSWQAVLGINTLTTLTMQNSYTDGELKFFNDCIGRMNYMLSRGQFTADVAILYPIASIWADFKPTTRHVHNLGDNPKARDVDEAWRYVSAQVLSCQRDFDYLDEALIMDAGIVDGELRIGKNSYSVLVLPHVTTLHFATLKKIEHFVESGGTVISWQTLPWNRADFGPEAELRSLVETLWNNSSGAVIHTMTEPGFRKAIKTSGTPDILVTPATREVYYQHRLFPWGDLFFVVNNSRDPVEGDFTFRTAGRAELWNPVNGEMVEANTNPTDAGNRIHLTLKPRSSVFVVFTR